MSLYLRVIQPTEIDEILSYEKKKLSETMTDEMDREFALWNSKWRPEALEHYLPMGWSFLARDPSLKSEFSNEGLLVGYFIGQPLLFFEGQTQSLWVEHLQSSTLQARDELTDLAYRLSREKHFQRVILPNTSAVANAINHLKPEPWGAQSLVVKTSKS